MLLRILESVISARQCTRRNPKRTINCTMFRNLVHIAAWRHGHSFFPPKAKRSVDLEGLITLRQQPNSTHIGYTHDLDVFYLRGREHRHFAEAEGTGRGQRQFYNHGPAHAQVCYIDTENTFRPERIRQIAEANGIDPTEALDNIMCAISRFCTSVWSMFSTGEKILRKRHGAKGCSCCGSAAQTQSHLTRGGRRGRAIPDAVDA